MNYLLLDQLIETVFHHKLNRLRIKNSMASKMVRSINTKFFLVVCQFFFFFLQFNNEKKIFDARTRANNKSVNHECCWSYLISRNWTDTHAERVEPTITVQEKKRNDLFVGLSLIKTYNNIHYHIKFPLFWLLLSEAPNDQINVSKYVNG